MARAGVCRVTAAFVLALGGGLATPSGSAAQPIDKAAAAAPAAVPAAVNQSTALAGTRQRTRFVIGLERQADFQVFSLQNPNRVVVDLPDVKVQLPATSGDQPVGLVKSFRGGLASAGKLRVIIDVTEPVVVERSTLEPGAGKGAQRLVLEIVPVDSAAKAALKKPVLAAAAAASIANVGLTSVQPPIPRPAERPEARAARAYKPVIVLDPGHGGHDSGAIRNGTVEKEVVLAFAHTLRDKLNATGRYKVLMTRDNDRFVPLDERRDFGEQNKAALFIAIHADYAGSSARGATIYSLRESVANDLKRSAKGEAAQNVLNEREIKQLPIADSGDKSAVKGILADLAATEVQVTKTRASLFSRSVVATMGESTNMMANPDRQATYRVLKTAKVPAVLIELAYVSNKEDAAKLKSDAWRSRVATSITTAVENYFSNQLARLPM